MAEAFVIVLAWLNPATADPIRRCLCSPFVFDDLQHLLISLDRGLKYFYDVELLYPLEEF